MYELFLPPRTGPLSAPSKFLTTDRTKRVKDARNEAQKEIEEYRNQKDDEFKKFEKEVRKVSFYISTHLQAPTKHPSHQKLSKSTR